MSKKKIIPVVLIAAAAGAFWWWDGAAYVRASLPASVLAYLPKPVDRSDMLYGNVDIREVSLGFRVGGRISELAVDEGDAVKAGDVLARLDDAPYRLQVDVAEAKVAALKATLAKLEAGPRQSEISQARAAYDVQLAAQVNARLVYERVQSLSRQGTVSQASLDEATSSRNAADARVGQAKAALDIVEEGARSEDISAAEAELAGAEAQLEVARTSLADTVLTAPEAGVVLSRVSERGAILGTGTPVFTLSLSEPVWVRTYVAEPDLGRIHPGLKVKVTTDSPYGSAYEGTVGFISPVAEFTPKSVETPDLRTDLVYRLRVVVAHPGKDLRQGMPVTVHLPPRGTDETP
jgi:HlyD family secretion protein